MYTCTFLPNFQRCFDNATALLVFLCTEHVRIMYITCTCAHLWLLMVTKIHFCPCCVSEIVNGFPFSLIDFMCDTVYMYVRMYMYTYVRMYVQNTYSSTYVHTYVRTYRICSNKSLGSNRSRVRIHPGYSCNLTNGLFHFEVQFSDVMKEYLHLREGQLCQRESYTASNSSSKR